MTTRLVPKTRVEYSVISIILTVLGWTIIVSGLIAGCLLGTSSSNGVNEFSFASALVYWTAGLISGSLMIGMSKIIDLLSIIANKSYTVLNIEEYDF